MAFGVLATVNGVGDFLSSHHRRRVVDGVAGTRVAFGYAPVLFFLAPGLVLRTRPAATDGHG